MRNFKVVGIIGKLNSGKDTATDEFIANGFERTAFADPIKTVLLNLFDIPREVLWGPSEKRTDEVRQMMQDLGTGFGRKYRPHVWINKVHKYIDHVRTYGVPGIVVSDVRYVNEAGHLHAMDATLIQVVRPGSECNATEEATAHSSEMEQEQIPEDWINETILNNGTLPEFQEKVAQAVKRVLA